MSCPSGKPAYASATEAARVKRKMGRRRNAEPHKDLRVYRCEKCSGWHLSMRNKSNLFRDKKRRAQEIGRHYSGHRDSGESAESFPA